MTVASSCAAPLDVVVVGGGISGLVAASILATRVSRIRVLEARSRVGGRLLSTQDGVDLGGGLMTHLPNGLLSGLAFKQCPST